MPASARGTHRADSDLLDRFGDPCFAAFCKKAGFPTTTTGTAMP
jgi:hypothetical protein